MGTDLRLERTSDYGDGQSVRAGEAIVSLPSVPHAFVTVGDEPKVIVEVEAPVP